MYNTIQPQTQFVVEDHPTSTSTAETIIGDGNIVTFHPLPSPPNDIRAFWGITGEDSSPSGLTDGSWQAIQIVQDDPNSLSAVYANGTYAKFNSGTGSGAGTGTYGNNGTLLTGLGGNGSAGAFATSATICEMGIQGISTNSTQSSALTSNQRSRYAF